MSALPLYTRIWWRFRDLWCAPFGHVLYFPRTWRFWAAKWECACAINQIGTNGIPSWESFDHYYLRMRRPVTDCERCWSAGRLSRDCHDCHGRGWYR